MTLKLIQIHSSFFKFSPFSLKLSGLVREPKYSHLKEFHRAIKLCEDILVSADPNVTSLGRYAEVSLCRSFLCSVTTLCLLALKDFFLICCRISLNIGISILRPMYSNQRMETVLLFFQILI